MNDTLVDLSQATTPYMTMSLVPRLLHDHSMVDQKELAACTSWLNSNVTKKGMMSFIVDAPNLVEVDADLIVPRVIDKIITLRIKVLVIADIKKICSQYAGYVLACTCVSLGVRFCSIADSVDTATVPLGHTELYRSYTDNRCHGHRHR